MPRVLGFRADLYRGFWRCAGGLEFSGGCGETASAEGKCQVIHVEASLIMDMYNESAFFWAIWAIASVVSSPEHLLVFHRHLRYGPGSICGVADFFLQRGRCCQASCDEQTCVKVSGNL